MSTIFQCIKPDGQYRPTRMTVVYEAKSEAEAIEWLENNGGGVYHNLLHNFDLEVAPTERKTK